VTMRATRTVVPSGPGLGKEGSLAPEATATSTPSTLPTSSATLLATETAHQQEVSSLTLPAVKAFTPEETTPNSVEGTGNTGT
jgi:hypothetical protein